MIAGEHGRKNTRIRTAPMRQHQHVVNADAEQPREFRVAEAASTKRKRVLEVCPVIAINAAFDWKVEVASHNQWCGAKRDLARAARESSAARTRLNARAPSVTRVLPRLYVIKRRPTVQLLRPFYVRHVLLSRLKHLIRAI